MALSIAAIRAVKPAAKPYKLYDSGGLFLFITPTGAKGWRFKYRFGGSEKLLSFGSYPDTSLKAARDKRDAARKQLASGVDPSALRKAEKAARGDANSFEAVARKWVMKYGVTWADAHAEKVIRRLERDVFPWLGAHPIGDITAPELLTVLQRIEARGAVETARRARQTSSQIFRYAIATGRAERDPAADLRGALAPVDSKHFAAITDPKAVSGLLRAIDGYQGSLVVKCALKLAPLTFVRPGELRKAQWSEFDLEDSNVTDDLNVTDRKALTTAPDKICNVVIDRKGENGREKHNAGQKKSHGWKTYTDEERWTAYHAACKRARRRRDPGYDDERTRARP